MISAVRAAPKSRFLGVRLGCGDIHALKRCFILTISLSLYSRESEYPREVGENEPLEIFSILAVVEELRAADGESITVDSGALVCDSLHRRRLHAPRGSLERADAGLFGKGVTKRIRSRLLVHSRKSVSSHPTHLAPTPAQRGQSKSPTHRDPRGGGLRDREACRRTERSG